MASTTLQLGEYQQATQEVPDSPQAPEIPFSVSRKRQDTDFDDSGRPDPLVPQTTLYWVPKTVHQVFIGATLQQISQVNVVEQTFDIEIKLHLRWLPTERDLQNFEDAPNEFEPEWKPQLTVTNKVDAVSVDAITVGDNGRTCTIKKGYVRQKLTISGKLGEKLELESFPFDCQDLPIKIEDKARASDYERVYFLPGTLLDLADIITVKTETLKLAEWDLVHVMAEFIIKDFGRNKKDKKHQLHFRCKVRRRSGSYLKRYAVVMTVICASSLLAFAMDPVDALPDRLAHCMTMLLTATAFQFVATSTLPQLSYLTLMDKYIMFCFGFIALVATAIGVTGRLEKGVELADFYTFVFSASFFIVGHIVFLGISNSAMNKEAAKLVYNQAQLDASEGVSTASQTMHVNEKHSYNDSYYEKDVTDELNAAAV